jgi:2-dehydropantoate 2-reductase
MCYTPLGKICASDHAMNAVDEMSRLAADFENFMDENGASYREWKRLECHSFAWCDAKQRKGTT